MHREFKLAVKPVYLAMAFSSVEDDSSLAEKQMLTATWPRTTVGLVEVYGLRSGIAGMPAVLWRLASLHQQLLLQCHLCTMSRTHACAVDTCRLVYAVKCRLRASAIGQLQAVHFERHLYSTLLL